MFLSRIALGNLFDPQPVDDEAEAEPEIEAEAGANIGGDGEEGAEAAQAINDGVYSIVLLEDNEEQRQQLIDLVSFTGFQVAEGKLNADIKELFRGCCQVGTAPTPGPP